MESLKVKKLRDFSEPFGQSSGRGLSRAVQSSELRVENSF